MPEGFKTYATASGTIVDVPESKIQAFTETFKDAYEVVGVKSKQGEGYIPATDFDVYVTSNPDVQPLEPAYQSYFAQNKIYSGVKPAPIPFSPNVTLGPAKPFQSTPAQPFPAPTEEEQEAANANARAKRVRYKAEAERMTKISPLQAGWDATKDYANDAAQGLLSVAPQTFKFIGENAKATINALGAMSPYGDVGADEILKPAHDYVGKWNDYFSEELRYRQNARSDNPTANFVGGLVPSAVQMAAVVAFPEIAAPYLMGMGMQTGGGSAFQYEEAQKKLGQPVDDDIKFLVMNLDAAIEGASEGLGTATRFTKGLFTGMSRKRIVESVLTDPSKYKKIISDFIAKNPSRNKMLWEAGKRVALQGGGEGLEEDASLLGQSIVHKALYDDNAFDGIDEELIKSFAGGFALGSIFSAGTANSYKNAAKQSIEQEGVATFGIDKKGKVFQIFNNDGKTFYGIDELGNLVEKDRSEIAQSVEITKEDYDQFRSVAAQNGTPTEQQNPIEQAVTQTAERINPVIHENGTHLVSSLLEDQPYFVKSGIDVMPDGTLDFDSVDINKPPIILDQNGNITKLDFFTFDTDSWEVKPAEQLLAETQLQAEQQAVIEQQAADIQNGIDPATQQPVAQEIVIGKNTYMVTENEDGSDSFDLSQSKNPEKDIEAIRAEVEPEGYTVMPVRENRTIPAVNKYKQPTVQSVIVGATVRKATPMNDVQLPSAKRAEKYQNPQVAEQLSTTFNTQENQSVTENPTNPTNPTSGMSEIPTIQDTAPVSAPVEETPAIELKPKQKKRFIEPSAEAKKLASTDPMSLEEAVLQYFVMRKQISTDDFKRLTGWGVDPKDSHGQTELKKYRWLHNDKGTPVDSMSLATDTPLIEQLIEQGGAMALPNAIADVITSHPDYASMLNRLKAIQNTDISPEDAERMQADAEYSSMIEEQKAEELYNEILRNLVDTYGQPPIELFNDQTDENTQTDNGGVSEQPSAGVNGEARNNEIRGVGDNNGDIEGGSGEEITPLTQEITAQQPNLNPSEAQKEAGNYKKAHVTVHGMDISVENPKGSFRRGVDEDGRAWETEMKSHYGYFKGTNGYDGDQIDTFIGENPESTIVFVVDQNNPKTGSFDESKVMLRYNTPEEAKAAYMSNYEPDWQGFGSITPVSVEDFKTWLYDGLKQRKPFANYKDTPQPIPVEQPKSPTELPHQEETAATGQPATEQPGTVNPVSVSGEYNIKDVVTYNNQPATIISRTYDVETKKWTYDIEVNGETIEDVDLTTIEQKVSLSTPETPVNKGIQSVENLTINDSNTRSEKPKFAGELLKEMNDNNAILKHRVDKKLSDKNLVAIHNINPESLLNADRIGGLPMPSLAITSKEKGFSSFGSISLIAEKSFVDPKLNRFSKVYGSDVYSARYPSISYTIDRTGNNKLVKKVNSVIPSEIYSDIVHRIKSAIEDRGLKSLANDSYAKILFLADTKRPFEYKKTALKYSDEIKQAFKDNNLTNIQYYEIANNPEIKKVISDIYMTQVSPEKVEYYNKYIINENGLLNDNIMRNFINDVQAEIRDSGKIDLRQTAYDAENYVRENELTDEYSQYITDFYTEIGVTEKIFKGFNYSGNRIYVPHTLENVLKEMKKDGIRGGEKIGYGAGSVRAQVTPQFKSLQEISNNKDKINSDIDKLKDETNTELIDLLEEIKKYYKFDGNRFGYYDSASEELLQVARSGKSESFNQLDNESQQKVSDFLNKLANMPTEYFEAKINRGVSLGEFKYALIPNNTSDKVRNVLNFNNIETIEYKSGDDADRLEKLNAVAEKDDQILFHKNPRFAGEALDQILKHKQSQAGFYSPTESALAAISQQKGTPEQFKAMLLKNGSKQAEMDWMGWDEFVSGKTTLTKDDVQGWIDQNKIEVKEVNLILDKDENKEYQNELENRVDEMVADDMMDIEIDTDIETREHFGIMNEPIYIEDGYYLGQADEDRVNEIALEKGYEDYSDLFNAMDRYFVRVKEENVNSKRNQYLSKYKSENNDGEKQYEKYSLPGGENYRELLLTLPKINNAEKLKQFHSSDYYAEAPIFAHVRFDERTDVDGNKVLFIEEIQSDWAQKGKKEGFKSDSRKVIAESLRKEKDNFYAKLNQSEDEQVEYGLSQFESGKITREQLDKILLANGYSEYDLKSAAETNSVPDMPFKKTDQWLNLAARRMMRYAAENGFDRIAWTTGDMQADRYDLSKQVDEIEIEDISEEFDGENVYSVIARKNNSEVINKYPVTDKELPELIGKDLAEKAIKDGGGKYSGLDLKVGGSGMRTFYDAIVPNAMSKLGKPFGAKVENTNINTGVDIYTGQGEFKILKNSNHPQQWGLFDKYNNELGRYNTYEEAKTQQESSIANLSNEISVQSLPITPQMRESVMEGVPLFHNQQNQQPTAKPTHDQIKTHAESIMKAKGITHPIFIGETPVEIVNHFINIGESPAKIWEIQQALSAKSTDGFFEPSSRTMVILSPRINSLEQLNDVIVHESTHATNRKFLSTRRTQVLDFFFDEVGVEEMNYFLPEEYARESKVVNSEEYIAYSIEYMVRNNITPQNNTLSYKEIIDIVEGNSPKPANFVEQLINTIYHETGNTLHNKPNGTDPIGNADTTGTGSVSEAAEGKTGTEPLRSVYDGSGKGGINETESKAYSGGNVQSEAQSKQPNNGLSNGRNSEPLRGQYEWTSNALQSPKKESSGNEGTTGEKPGNDILGNNNGNQAEKPRFAGELLGEGSLGLLKSISSNEKYPKIQQDEQTGISETGTEYKRDRRAGETGISDYKTWKEQQLPRYADKARFLVSKAVKGEYLTGEEASDLHFIYKALEKADYQDIHNNTLLAISELLRRHGYYSDKTVNLNRDYFDKVNKLFTEMRNGKKSVEEPDFTNYDTFFGNNYLSEPETKYGIPDTINVDSILKHTTPPTEFAGEVLNQIKKSPLQGKRIIGKKDYGDIFADWIAENVHSVDLWQQEMKKDGFKGIKLFDIYSLLRRRKGIIKGLIDRFDNGVFTDLEKTVARMIDKHNISSKEIQKYLKAKSAIERNDNEKWVEVKNKVDSEGHVLLDDIGEPITYEVVHKIKAISDDPDDQWGRVNVENIILSFENKVPKQEVDNLWSKIKSATDYAIDALYLDGVISKEDHKKYTNRKYYVPLRGWEFDEQNTNPEDFYDYVNNEKNGINSQTYVKATIKAKGRTSEPGDPLPYIRQLAHSAVMTSVKNRIARTGLQLFRINQNDPKVTQYMYLKAPFKGNSHQAKRTRQTAEKHEVMGYENGDRFVLVIGDPHVAQSIKGENVVLRETAKWLGESAFGKLTQFMKANFTGKNPNFFLNNFLFIDVPYAAITEGIREEGESGQFVKQMLTGKPFKTIHRDIKGKLNPLSKGEAIEAGLNSQASIEAAIQQYGESRVYDTLYEMWKDAGGPTGWMQLESFEKSAKKIESEINRIRAKEATFGTGTGKLSTKDKFTYNYPLRKGAELMDYIMTMSEQSSRFAVFVSRKMAGQNTADAALASKEATVDFDRTGQASTVFNQLFAFFKPTVSATYGIYKMAKANKAKFGYALGSFYALGVLQAILAYMSFPDDDKDESTYDGVPDYDKLNNLVFPRFWDEKSYSEGKYVKIPLPQFFRAIFALGVTSTQAAMGKMGVGKFVGTNMGNLITSLTPFNMSGMELGMGGKDLLRTIMPTAFTPAYDIAVNETFSGRPVYKEMFTKDLEDKTPESQKGLKSTFPPLVEAAQWWNEVGGGNEYTKAGSGLDPVTGIPQENKTKELLFDFNPAKIQHVFETVGGGRVKFFRQVFSTTMAIATPEKDLNDWDIPLFYRYLGRTKDSDPKQAYYNAQNAVRDFRYYINKEKSENPADALNKLSQYGFMIELEYLTKNTKKQIDFLQEQADNAKDSKIMQAKTDSINITAESFKNRLLDLEKKYKITLEQ